MLHSLLFSWNYWNFFQVQNLKFIVTYIFFLSVEMICSKRFLERGETSQEDFYLFRSLFSLPGIGSGETEDKILGKGHELWSIVYF